MFDNITRKSRKALLPLILLTTAQLSYAGGSLPVASNNVMVTKNLTSKKLKVKLFTASDYKTLLFTVDGLVMKQYTLFIFDLEGRLITQSIILNRETGILPEIASGTYLYEVLTADARVENGQLKIK